MPDEPVMQDVVVRFRDGMWVARGIVVELTIDSVAKCGWSVERACLSKPETLTVKYHLVGQVRYEGKKDVKRRRRSEVCVGWK